MCVCERRRGRGGDYYKHKNVLSQKNKIFFKKTLRGVANALGVLIVVLVLGPLIVVVAVLLVVVVVVLHLLATLVAGFVLGGSLTAIECQVKWQCVRRRFAFAICNNQSKTIKI